MTSKSSHWRQTRRRSAPISANHVRNGVIGALPEAEAWVCTSLHTQPQSNQKRLLQKQPRFYATEA
jgi:hypothetical protein